MFKKILVANRGEIALRIIKACNELNITAAVIYSEADKTALHVRLADEAYNIGGPRADESYLNQNKIISLAKEINADAIHPGYGFLSENAQFIEKVERSGITFIGPSSNSVKLMGDKTSARRLMTQNNVPIVPGTTEPITTIDDAMKSASDIGYPIMLKAAGGGGGKGMRVVRSESELEESFNLAKSESQKAFARDDIYIEKYLVDPKHIEVQIIADHYGNYRHLFERECSLQRRHQKIIEEAPSPSINEKDREKITTIALNAAKACNYHNAGTIELLMDEKKSFYFLEMNTRVQVEHPVTEFISNIDIVKEQIKIASGEKISFKQDELKILGHSIECRIYAEDSLSNFAPSVGVITNHFVPHGVGIRIDTGIDTNSEVSIYYDPILSKLITFGRDREEAISRMLYALKNYLVTGVTTNIPFCKWIMQHNDFVKNKFNINFIGYEIENYLNQRKNAEILSDEMTASIIVSSLLYHEKRSSAPKLNFVSKHNKWTVDHE
ncbi:Biotin carboxylase of acetyl-CoA carboxylase [hydrothermal vent metagenome]|uniref:Biotin carboxylase of acetyl-CoA carboxylase n=1 Tax=hydrothermal vent metagenome TaxID=652676 RepID=A0A3B1CIY1_9ZZZZ